jgi:hypothetical protein
MEKSGDKATPSPNLKRRKNIVTFPATNPDASPKPSPPPSETPAPDPQIGLTAAHKALMKFLGRYKIGIRRYETCAKIGDVVLRGIGSRQRAFETLKFSKHPDAQRLLLFCSRLGLAARTNLPLEALCLAAGVDPIAIAGALVTSARDLSRMESALVTMREHPNMVEATARWGQMFADNAKDREMMHKAVGWLPTPKGSRINVNLFDPKLGVRSDDGREDDDDELDDGVPTLEGVVGSDPMEIENWGERRRALLEAGK